eukprot:CAMPEP_0184490888 /NCGR_PEP_ID=MMETSP0113_2-20130426/19153_1 /TAXON_ID=91329 /ORGANISM="Norrisiella sphaerica, Strain BC52" /LENGTH=268 /DNA_ID=CAMNT_0026875013 /DNA_START=72 /DNA_END=875 /DNA_ORIENTATION=-
MLGRLPVFESKEQIVEAIDRNQVVVIAGSTGSGKSTQVPQFVLNGVERGRHHRCNIVVTQPRRISAISLSQRVAWERRERVGESVGYQIRLDSRTSKLTRLTYVTTGVLLRQLMGLDKGSTKTCRYTHIMVDEVHERDYLTDLLLIVVKRLLRQDKSLKVVLMSATLDSDLFSKYFDSAPVLEIPGRSYPVKILYKEDILSALSHSERKGGTDAGNTDDLTTAGNTEDYNSPKGKREKRKRSPTQSLKLGPPPSHKGGGWGGMGWGDE